MENSQKLHLISCSLIELMSVPLCSGFSVDTLYNAHLQKQYKNGSMQRQTIAYNDARKMFLCEPRFYSASHLFISINIPTCQAEIRNLMYKCMCRLDKVENSIIHAFVNPTKSCILTQYFCDMIPLLHFEKGLCL